MSAIPLVDLKAQHAALKDELDAAVARCVAAASFIGGPDHKAFAEEFAAFCGGGHAALCGNGTDALQLAILALLGRGDGTGEIVTVANTFIATAEAILLAGYAPVFVDVDPATRNMDPDLLEAAITPRTRAVLPVHLFGLMAPMDRITEIARRRGLAVIEDSAQAHGASWLGKGPGQWGDAACFSFFPGKNLGAWGDAGAVFTRDPDLAERVRLCANHGRRAKYEHEFEGTNSRLDGLQAAVLRVKLPRLAGWNQRRREAAALYDSLLSGRPGLTLPRVPQGAAHAFHLYVVELDERDRVLAGLQKEGVQAGVHYPIPLHEQPVYRRFGLAPEALPVTSGLARRILSLPIFPEITAEQVRRVAETLLGLL